MMSARAKELYRRSAESGVIGLPDSRCLRIKEIFVGRFLCSISYLLAMDWASLFSSSIVAMRFLEAHASTSSSRKKHNLPPGFEYGIFRVCVNL